MSGTEYINNICLICVQEYKDDFESIFVNANNNELSQLGLLYEELFNLSIQADEHHPQFLCNYCNLQLKLFYKFKLKAIESYKEFSEYAKNKEHDEFFIMESSCEKSEVMEFEIVAFKDELEECETASEMSASVIDKENHQEVLNEVEFDELHRLEGLESKNESDDLSATKQKLPQITNFSCEKCDKVFEKHTHLVKHRRALHKITKYECNMCPKKFKSEELFKAHIKVHNGLPAYQCNLCDKTFKQKIQYIYHNQGHQNEKNAHCDICGKGFRNKFDLRTHLRMHSDERPYECDICGKKFRAHTHMTNHRYSHFGKTLECELCRQKYTSPNTLKSHIKSVHRGECPYMCLVCKKRFKRSYYLKIHHQKVHSPKKTVMDS